LEYTPKGRVTTFDNAGLVTCQEEGSGSVCPMPGGLPFAFNGQWRSSLTGLSYMRNRWYSPRLGQFMSHDPLHYVDSVNLYSFASFDPINSWDPMGLDSALTETKIDPVFINLEEDDIVGDSGDDSDDFNPDPLDTLNPLDQGLRGGYLLGWASNQERDNYNTKRQKEKFGKYLPKDTVLKCRVSCEINLLAIVGDSVEATFGIVGGLKSLLEGGIGALSKFGKNICSFTENTPVMMCDGELRAIQDVQEGEWVLARDERTGEVSCRQVVAPYDNPGRSIILVTLTDVQGNSEIIETTDNHPFYVEGSGWTRVDHLNLGDLIPSAERGLLTVNALEWTPRIETVYNFGVDEFHTYFVGEIGAWVHNCFDRLKGKLGDMGRDEYDRLASKWDAATFDDVGENLEKHAAKHGDADDIAKYMRKADNFNYKGAKSTGNRPEFGDTTKWERKSGEFIIKNSDGKIVTYGNNNYGNN